MKKNIGALAKDKEKEIRIRMNGLVKKMEETTKQGGDFNALLVSYFNFYLSLKQKFNHRYSCGHCFGCSGL